MKTARTTFIAMATASALVLSTLAPTPAAAADGGETVANVQGQVRRGQLAHFLARATAANIVPVPGRDIMVQASVAVPAFLSQRHV